ncbi:hypothetical protein [Thiomonas sp.]
MKIAAGIAGILLGLLSLMYVGIFGSMVGSAAGWLGSIPFQGNNLGPWAEMVSMLSWLAPLVTIVGGIVTFSNPRVGGIILGVGAFLHWNLLGLGQAGKLFVFPIGAIAALALFARSSTRIAINVGANQTFAEPGSPSNTAGPSFDRAKWNALVQYDQDISSLAEKLQPLGTKWVDQLASSYLALNDKKYLPDIERKIVAAARVEAEENKRERIVAEEQRKAQTELWRNRGRTTRKFAQLTWGTQTRRIVTLSGAVLLLAIVVSLHFLMQPAKVDASIVWSAKFSDSSPCPDITCLVGQMEQHHATKMAVDFARELTAAKGVPTWVAKFYKFGPVDMVAYDCLPPACEYHGGFALVNGSPRIVLDTSELVMLRYNPEVQQWLSRNGGFLTRYYGFEREFQLQDGTQRFVFVNTISQCEACQPSAAVEFAFDFNNSGKLISKSVLDVLPKTPSGLAWPPGH